MIAMLLRRRRQLSGIDAWRHLLVAAVTAADERGEFIQQKPKSGSPVAGTIDSRGLSVTKAQGG